MEICSAKWTKMAAEAFRGKSSRRRHLHAAFDAFERALQHYSTHLNTFTARPWGVAILMLQCRDFRATRGISSAVFVVFRLRAGPGGAVFLACFRGGMQGPVFETCCARHRPFTGLLRVKSWHVLVQSWAYDHESWSVH